MKKTALLISDFFPNKMFYFKKWISLFFLSYYLKKMNKNGKFQIVWKIKNFRLKFESEMNKNTYRNLLLTINR